MRETKEILTHATHVNGWFPVVYMSCMSQNFRLFHASNLSVRNFRIFLLMYTGSLSNLLQLTQTTLGFGFDPYLPMERPWSSETSFHRTVPCDRVPIASSALHPCYPPGPLPPPPPPPPLWPARWDASSSAILRFQYLQNRRICDKQRRAQAQSERETCVTGPGVSTSMLPFAYNAWWLYSSELNSVCSSPY